MPRKKDQQFQKYSAGDGGSDDWYSKKQRGRDDEAIARAKETAKEARRLRNSRTTGGRNGGIKKNNGKNNNNNKRKRQKSTRDRYESANAVDLEDFIVDDDEIEHDERTTTSNDDSVVEILDSPQSKRQKKVDLTVDESSSSDDELGTFFESHPKRTSRPPPPIQRQRTKTDGGGALGQRRRIPRKNKKAPNYREDDNESVSSPETKRSSFMSSRQGHRTNNSRLSFSDWDDDGDYNPQKKVQTKKSSKTKEVIQLLEDNSVAASVPQPKAENGNESKVKITQEDTDNVGHQFTGNDTDSSSYVGNKQRNKTNKRSQSSNNTGIPESILVSSSGSESRSPDNPPSRNGTDKDLLDSDEESQPRPQKRKRLQKCYGKSYKQNQDFRRDETQMADKEADDLALAKALSLSEAQHNRKQDTRQEEILEVDDDSDGDDDNDDDANDDAYQENQEARSVLDTANELSKKVLRNMKSWSHSNDADADATSGMIVDGALALYSCSNAKISAAGSSTSWVSSHEMQTIVPEIELADYQLIGVNWLILLHGMKISVGEKKQETNVNGVLADSMGLGKTVQTIAFLAWLKYVQTKGLKQEGEEKENCVPIKCEKEQEEKKKTEKDATKKDPANAGGNGCIRPHLVVVPASVLSNWEREFDRFCPDITVCKYHGTQKERALIRDELRPYLPKNPKAGTPRFDVILTTFSYFSTEKSTDRDFLRKFNFDYLVVDEAHCLKNPSGLRYRNLDRLSTSHRLLLTGTPVQNSPKELMSLLCFLMPLFSRPSKKGWDESHSNDGGERMLRHFVSLEGGDAKSDREAYQKLKQLFAPFVLRRRKEDVMQQAMPPKKRELLRVDCDEATKSVYTKILENHLMKKRSGSSSLFNNKSLFTLLRKAANHPLLLRNRHTSTSEIDHLSRHLQKYGYFGRHVTCTLKHIQEELENYSDFDVHNAAMDVMEEDKKRRKEMERYQLDESDLFTSPKFERLRTLLPDLVKGNHRILIFSQWTRILDLLGCLLESIDMKFLRLDGSTQIAERQKLIDKFNGDSRIPVFLLSTRAGGLGINLTAADTCILHDLDFNPFNDLQAEDRCHRIGQKNPVTVYKMVTNNTVDSDIFEMQERKAKMNAAILEKDGVMGKDEEANEVNKMIEKTMGEFLSQRRQDDDKEAKTDDGKEAKTHDLTKDSDSDNSSVYG